MDNHMNDHEMEGDIDASLHQASARVDPRFTSPSRSIAHTNPSRSFPNSPLPSYPGI